MGSDAAERALRGRIAAHTRWAGIADRSAATAPARAGLRDRFLRQARQQFGDLPEHELAVRAEHLRKAFYARLALASAKARSARSAVRKAGA